MDLRLPETTSAPAPAGDATVSTPAPMVIRPAWTERVLAYRLLWVLAFVVFALDQITKILIVNTLDYPTYWPSEGAITVIDGFFYLVHVGNTGAAWSLFAGQSSLLAALAGITLIGIFFWRRHLGLHDRRAQVAFGLLCGGIVGNFLDRVLYGHVVDFLDFHFGDYIYPTFNLADAGICIGVLLYLWHSFTEPESTP